MIHRFDQITVDFPTSSEPDANAAAAIQELLGGKFGEMSTLMNYTFQSFNFRGRKNFRPFYDLISNIAAEEYSHIEAVSCAINLLLTGATPRTDRNKGAKTGGKIADPAKKHSDAKTDPAPLKEAADFRNTSHFLNSAQQALPMDSMGRFWTGENVFSSGNLKLDLLHNFFLECGARAGKIRAYEATDHPVARAMVGYLLVRGGTHVVAYAKALEVLTGANVGALLPIPDVSNRKFPEARKLEEEQGLHLVQYHQSKDYTQISKIWNGPHPEDGQPLVVKEEMPPGFPWPILDEEPQLSSPGDIDPEMIQYYADKLG
jgi:Mn-containing catalase